MCGPWASARSRWRSSTRPAGAPTPRASSSRSCATRRPSWPTRSAGASPSRTLWRSACKRCLPPAHPPACLPARPPALPPSMDALPLDARCQLVMIAAPPCRRTPPALQDARTRPTAKYLQQHKFVAREATAAAAVRALLPLVQQARQHLAEIAVVAGMEAAAPLSPSNDDAAFSWRQDPRGTLPAGGGGGRQSAAYIPVYGASGGTVAGQRQQHLQQQQQPASGLAYQQTVAASGGASAFLRASADGGGGGSSPSMSGGGGGGSGPPSATIVVRQSADGKPWGAASPLGASPPSAGGGGEGAGGAWGAGGLEPRMPLSSAAPAARLGQSLLLSS